MDESERKDLNWMIAHGMQDIDLAHEARLKSEEEKAAKERLEKARLAEEARRTREARLQSILLRHLDRWLVSVNGLKVVAGKKVISFSCPKCGAELPRVLESLGEAMGGTFERLWTEDFSNSSGRAHFVVSELTCKCGQRIMYRCIPLPF